MPAYKIIYERADMPKPCVAMKFAHTKEDALGLLCTGTEKKGLRLDKKGPAGVAIKLIEIKEL
jgi:hypothetical protein